jgi:hypothetical protein
MRWTTAAAAAALLAAGCATVPAETPAAGSVQPAPAPADARAIPRGTILNVSLDQELSTTSTRVGDTFSVSVLEPLVALNGRTVVPEGATLTGMVTGVGTSDDGGPRAAIRLNFLRINVDDVWHPISADIVHTAVPADSRRSDTSAARGAVVGAAAGAVLGTILTGDLRDALIGAVLGAGAGTIISLGLGDVEPVLPRGTHMQIQTLDRIELRR